MTALDVYATGTCPVGIECAGCGAVGVALAVATADTTVGVLCATVCDACAEDGRLPPLPVPIAVRAVGEHCGHLGVDIDTAESARTARSA